MKNRLDLVILMNPEFAEAFSKAEPWSVQYADEVKAIDGQGSRKYPHRRRKEDGEPHRFCGGCPFPEGCVSCDLD